NSPFCSQEGRILSHTNDFRARDVLVMIYHRFIFLVSRLYCVDVLSISVAPCLAYLGRYFFFFQAEDGIRDATVTGVQTCALPISEAIQAAHALRRIRSHPILVDELVEPGDRGLSPADPRLRLLFLLRTHVLLESQHADRKSVV